MGSTGCFQNSELQDSKLRYLAAHFDRPKLMLCCRCLNLVGSCGLVDQPLSSECFRFLLRMSRGQGLGSAMLVSSSKTDQKFAALPVAQSPLWGHLVLSRLGCSSGLIPISLPAALPVAQLPLCGHMVLSRLGCSSGLIRISGVIGINQD